MRSQEPVTWLMALIIFLTFTFVGAAVADERAELKGRFEQRDPALVALKKQGTIGETWQGYVDVVKEEKMDAAARQLMNEENQDRKRLYELIAKDGKETAVDVGMRNAMRNFALASQTDFLRAKVGPWVQRGDVAVLKREGKIGETWQGYLGIVDPAADDEKRLTAVVFVENTAREDGYRRNCARARSTDMLLAIGTGSSVDRAAAF